MEETSALCPASFEWKGPSSINQGLYKVESVTVAFEESESEYCVHIPAQRGPNTEFSFVRDTKSFKQIGGTAKMLKGLTLIANCCEETPYGPTIADTQGRLSRHTIPSFFSHDIKLEMPEQLEDGHAYRLVVSASKQLNLSAELVPISLAAQDKKAILQLLNDSFGQTIPLFSQMFVALLVMQGIPAKKPKDASVDSAAAVLSKMVDQLESDQLASLGKQVRGLGARLQQASESEHTKLVTATFGACVKALPDEALREIVRTPLLQLVPEEATDRAESVLKSVCAQFEQVWLEKFEETE